MPTSLKLEGWPRRSRRKDYAFRSAFSTRDKKGRNSLVWDAIEPLRPAIDAKVFAFVEAHEFARCDFPQSGYNVHRLSRAVTQLLLHHASLPAREIEEGGFRREV